MAVIWARFILGLTILGSVSAQARLGDQLSASALNQQKSNSLAHVRAASSGSNVTIVPHIESTYTLNEYLDQNGFVFAVTWRGFVKPDLSDTLGSYYAGYQKIDDLRERAFSRAPVKTETSDIVVLSEGHPRDWQGHAYVVSRVPSDFNLGSLK
jgi:hypothetical protein